MKKDRGSNLGKCVAYILNYLISTLPENQRESYTHKLTDELKKYSFMPKKKSEQPNEGCVYELEDIITKFNPKDPTHPAKVCKEIAHWRYNKAAAASFLNSILDCLQQNP